MKVLFLNYEYPPLGGGAGNATAYILREFSKIKNLEVDLITSSFDKNFHLEKVGENVKIHKLPIGKNKKNIHFQSQKDILTYTWKAYFYARKLARENNYDLSHSFFTIPCGFVSWILKKQFQIPYIVSLRGSDVPGYSERFDKVYRFLKPLVKKIWKDSFFVVANSQGLKELALRTDSKQIIGIIYNGIDTEEFKPLENKKVNEKFIILSVSRITPRKGLRYLLLAGEILKKENFDFEIILAGEGDEADDLKKLCVEKNISNEVKFLGAVKHDQLPKIYARSDVFVLPSLNEGMSNVVLEALSSGLPIIATDTGGTKELVEDKENGFIVEVKNAKDIAEKIKKLIRDSQLAKNMGQKSRQKAETMGWKKVAEKYLESYQKTNNDKK